MVGFNLGIRGPGAHGYTQLIVMNRKRKIGILERCLLYICRWEPKRKKTELAVFRPPDVDFGHRF